MRKVSRKSELAAAFRYMRGRWPAPVRCFDDGRLASGNNPAERALRGVAIGPQELAVRRLRRGWTPRRRDVLADPKRVSTKLNGLNPQLYIAELLARIADHPARHIADLLPWNWQPAVADRAAA